MERAKDFDPKVESLDVVCAPCDSLHDTMEKVQSNLQQPKVDLEVQGIRSRRPRPTK